MNIPGYSAVLVALSVFALYSPGFAQNAESDPAGSESGHPMMSHTWDFWIGGFFPSVESEVRIDSNLGSPGDNIDMEDTFGLEDSKTVLWGGARWRFKTRHRLEIEIADLNRSGTVAGTTGELDIGDHTIRAGARIDSEFDLTLIRTTYGYSVFRRPKHELSLKAGLHMTNTKIAIDAFGDIEDVNTGQTICDPSPCEANVESSDFTVPLPHFGLAYGYGFTPKWVLRSQALFFALEINDVEGSLIELDLDLQYKPWEHVGFGVGLRYFNVTVEDNGNSFFRGKFEYDYWGPAVYVTGSF